MSNNKKVRSWLSWFKKYQYVFALAALLALLVGFLTWQRGAKYSVSLALTVSRYGTQNAADYKYDSYYALKASSEFGDTVAGWLKTPETAQAVARRTGAWLGNKNLNSLSRLYKAAKVSPNLVEVRFSAVSQSEAKNVSQALVQIIQEKANALNSSSWQGIAFLTLAGEPVIVKNTEILWRNILAGFLLGLVLGFLGRLVWPALKEGKNL